MSYRQARRQQVLVSGPDADPNLHVYVLRGIPGSGKSTYVAEILARSDIAYTLKNRKKHVVSNDDYSTRFYQKATKQMKNYLSMTDAQLDHPLTNYQQRYVFSPTNFDAIQKLIADKMANRITPLIIDNTNTSDWEMIAPVVLARKYHYTLHIMEFDYRNIPDQLYSAGLQKRKTQTSKDIPPHLIANFKTNMLRTMQKTDRLIAETAPAQRGLAYQRRIRQTPIQEIADYAYFSPEVLKAWGREYQYQKQALAHMKMGNVFD